MSPFDWLSLNHHSEYRAMRFVWRVLRGPLRSHNSLQCNRYSRYLQNSAPFRCISYILVSKAASILIYPIEHFKVHCCSYSSILFYIQIQTCIYYFIQLHICFNLFWCIHARTLLFLFRHLRGKFADFSKTNKT